MRIISSQAQAVLDSGRGYRRTLVRLAPLGIDPVCVWDDVGTISYSGDTYQGAAGRFIVELPESTLDLTVRGAQITFSGLDPAIVDIIETANWSQRPARIMEAVAEIDSPHVLYVETHFSGFMDIMEWEEASLGKPSKLVLKLESTSREFSLSGARTASDADQRDRDPADGFFKFMASAVTRPIDWGRAPQSPPEQTVQQKSGFGALLDKIF